MINADIVASVYFLKTSEGGRECATPPMRMGCIFEYDHRLFDCMLMLDGKPKIYPGETAIVAIKFLPPEVIKPMLSKGTQFILRDYRTIARGIVDEIR